jgi:drug/metabolite transporter (DMT)-like permease
MFLFFYKKISFDFNSLKATVILGFFNFLAFSLQTIALKFTPSNIIGLITGLYVIFTPFVALFVLKRKVNLYNLIGAFLAFFGMYLLVGNGVKITLGIGEILTILCAVAIAFHISFTEIYARKYNIYSLVTFQFLFISIFSLFFISFENRHFSFSFNVIFALLITSLFATVFAYYVQTKAQQYISATKTAIIYALEPLSAAVFGIFNGEKLKIFQIMGGGLIILAMIVSEVGEKLFQKRD